MRIPLLAVMMLWSFTSYADDEASNRVYVTASRWGQFYARSIPAEAHGQKGRTEIYQVGQKDTLLHSYDWYSPEVHLEGYRGGSVYVVQMGPWHRGHRANHEDLALAIHRNGALVRRHSTLEIAGSPDNVRASVSHYVVFDTIMGLQADIGGYLYLEVLTTDRRRLLFDLQSGRIVSEDERSRRRSGGRR